MARTDLHTLTADALGLPDVQARLLAAYMDAAVHEFPRHYRVDGCIAAARVAADVFEKLHVPARPLSVVVEVFNPGLVARASREGGRVPQTQEEYVRWQAEDAAWWMTLGEGEPEVGKWAGHAVAVAWGGVVIDLTLAQVNRPAKGIVLPPLIFDVRTGFLAGEEERVLAVNGCELHYRARPGDRSFMGSRDWTDRARHRDVVRAIYRRVRTELGRRL